VTAKRLPQAFLWSLLAGCATVGVGPPADPTTDTGHPTAEQPQATDVPPTSPEAPLANSAGEPEPVDRPTAYDGPRAPREFRAAWVATVANINWPSEPGLPPDVQRQEAISLLDLLQGLNFNAVILQVRPQADALYPSDLEPWSYYLTGEQGQGPVPAYDPLAFWIEEAHDRGLELHAWLNPYRAHHPAGGPLSESSLVRTRPELVVHLSTEDYWWMDPALEETQEHSRAVVLDIVRRYDVDGIHFDDYFYPYPSYNGGRDFPDHQSWAAYQAKGGSLSRDDWRRNAVDTFIRDLYQAIKEKKPWVKFGLSPFGIWRPGFPASIEGFDQYAELFADARLWLNEGWIDYWTPQLYWPINQIPQSYPVLLGWWAEQNSRGRHLWPGINIGRIQGSQGADEAVNQIMVTRGMVSDGPGNVHWSIGPLIENQTLADGLAAGPYRGQALVPASPWLDSEGPAPPKVSTVREGREIVVTWEHPLPQEVFLWVTYVRREEGWSYRILPRFSRNITLDPSALDDRWESLAWGGPVDLRPDAQPRTLEIAVSAVDRSGNESRKAVVTVPSG